MTTAQAVIFFLLIFFYRWLSPQCSNMIQPVWLCFLLESAIILLNYSLCCYENQSKGEWGRGGSLHFSEENSHNMWRLSQSYWWKQLLLLSNYTKPPRNVQSSFINAYERRAKSRDLYALGCTAGHKSQGSKSLSPQSLRQGRYHLSFNSSKGRLQRTHSDFG